ncbi:MAG: DUF4129 domain-containing protein [Alphaproteobacteria bacterium]
MIADLRLAGMVMLLLAAGLFVFSPAPAAAAESIEQAVKKVLGDKSIQSALPGKGQAQAPRIGGRPSRRPRGSTWRGFGAVGQIILWGLVVLAGGLLVYFIIREYAGYRRRPRRARDGASADGAIQGPAEPAAPEDLLAEADRLAARGEFAEAVHLILIHSLRRLEAGGTRALGASLTAREIVSRAGLQSQARGWFAHIVGASERVHFGGRDADAPAYAKCREAFEKLAGEIAAPAGEGSAA